MRKKLFTLLTLIVAASYGNAQTQINIIPQPVQINMGKGNFILNPKTVVYYQHPSLASTANLFTDYLKNAVSISLQATQQKKQSLNVIELQLAPQTEKDAYRLQINKDKIVITAQEPIGVFYGLQSLLQLLPPQTKTIKPNSYKIPGLSIYDYPRFSYRGMHLDVCRHFQPVSYIKKYIDYLAFHKFNTFHWHLTDDQGWRLEIKQYPLLTQVGGFRNGTTIGRYPGTGNDGLHYGGFYTQKEAKEIVQYAAERFITVIPEIELPGHASAAIAAYPQLSCFPLEDTKVPENTAFSGPTSGKQVQQTWGVFEDVFCPSEFTFNFLENVFDEVLSIFPSKIIHIGGDECPKENWKRSDLCQQMIKEKNLKDEHGLQSYFIQRIEKYLNSKGRNIIGWDEILEGGLAPNAAVMSWRGEAGGIEAAKQKHYVVMTPSGWLYFDHSQSLNEDSVVIGGYNSLEKVYHYDPLPKELSEAEQKYILGAQANLWTEYIKNPAKIEYMIFPRMSALSEVLWTQKKEKNWDRFQKKLPTLFKRYQSWGAQYSKAYYQLENSLTLTAQQQLAWVLKTKSTQHKIIYQYNDGPIKTYTGPVVLHQSGTIKAALANAQHQAIGQWIQQSISLNKATAKPTTLSVPPSKKYKGNGAFTLTDGVQNSKGLSRSTEFIGYLGTDVAVVIDLQQLQPIKKINAHVLAQSGSWIYPPKQVSFFKSNDGLTYESLGQQTEGSGKQNKLFSWNGDTQARFIKVLFTNIGNIPTGMEGAGNKAWLFLDEIEIF